VLTLPDIIDSVKRSQCKPDEEELRSLPYKNAFIYGRVSSPAQVRDSRESIREIAELLRLAKEDGYQSDLQPDKVEQWLQDIQKDIADKVVWQQGQITLDVRDLGLSARFPGDDRQGFSHLLESIERGQTGAVYVSEASRLTRDQTYIEAYKLLELFKKHGIRVRTPYYVKNPQIPRDWDYLQEELQYAIKEGKALDRRLNHRRRTKAERGEYVGEPIPAGFILPVLERESSGQYKFSKMQPYPPHVEVVIRILSEFVKQGGSVLKTHRALGRLTYPYFPENVSYMERRSALRTATKTESGYLVSPTMTRSLATNLKLIGIWTWGNIEPISNNHAAIVPVDLFLEAYNLATRPGKPRGKSISREPLEWHRLVYCCNHDIPVRMSSNTTRGGAYRCEADYVQGRGPTCLDITARYLDEPLTKTVLRQLDFTPLAEDVLMQSEAAGAQAELEMEQRKREIARLENKLENLKPYLGCGDNKREEVYWHLYERTKEHLDELRSRPLPGRAPDRADYHLVRDFLVGLPRKFDTYPRALRNRLLRCIIDRVEIRHAGQDVDATVYWKTGQVQELSIRRARAKKNRESRWSDEELTILQMLWPSSSQDAILAALPGRTWKAVAHQANSHRWKRSYSSKGTVVKRRWKADEEQRTKQLYESGTPLQEITSEMKRSRTAILQKASENGWQRPHPEQGRATTDFWSEKESPIVSNGSTSGRGLRG